MPRAVEARGTSLVDQFHFHPAPRAATSATRLTVATPSLKRRAFIRRSPLMCMRHPVRWRTESLRQTTLRTQARILSVFARNRTNRTSQVWPAACRSRLEAEPRSWTGGQQMLLAALAVIALLTVPLAGGQVRLLADLRLRAVPLLFGALGLQVVIISVLPAGDGPLHRWLHLSTYVVVLGWAALNAAIPWRWTVVVGGLSNFVAIVANRGVMPSSRDAIAAAGLGAHHGFANSAAVAHPTLGYLGDVFATPTWMPLHNVYSVGDALIVFGIFLVLHRQCESFLAYIVARACDAPMVIVRPVRALALVRG